MSRKSKRSVSAGHMDSEHISGVITFPGGIFDRLKIDGVCTTTGSLEANELHIEGVFTGEGDVKADRFDCEGVVTISGNLRAKHADIDGVVTVNGNKVEADHIKCDGVLTIIGQVSADVIEAQGFINATEIVGDRIIIKSFRKSPIFKLWIKFKEAVGDPDFSKVDLIEATTVELRGVRARSVNGENVIIGPACVIDEVGCTGTLSIDPTATVNTINGSAKQG